MSCPICLEEYSKENPAKGPSIRREHECRHSVCSQCFERIRQTTKEPPFRCPECRRDITLWFLQEIHWDKAYAAMARAEEQISQAEAVVAEAHQLVDEMARANAQFLDQMQRQFQELGRRR